MTRSTQNRLILAAITAIFLLIPLTSYLMLQRAKFEHLIDVQFPEPSQQASEISMPKTTSSLQEIKTNIASIPSPTPGFIMDGEPAILGAEASSSGLKLRVKMNDRILNNQSSQLFVGIGQGEAMVNPKYVLSFLVNLDQNGQYSGISLTGLEPNSIYTAYIKGISQLATTREFSFQTGLADLGLITLISGDVNNDNQIDQSDVLLVKKNMGKNSHSLNFDSSLDVNNDGIINSLDLSIIMQNLGKSGEAGVIFPSQLNEATKSAELQNPDVTGSPESSSSAQKNGYWLWIPKLE